MINFFNNMGSVNTPPSKFKDAVRFTLRGQSNALGRAVASSLPNEDQLPQEDIYIYKDPSSVQLYQAGVNSGDTGQYGVELFLAQLLRDYHNKPVIIDKYAVGGTILADDTWVKGSWNINQNELWPYGKDIYTSVNKFEKTVFLKGQNKVLIWFQGESDSDSESYANAYEQNERDIFNDWRSFVGDANFKIVDLLTYTGAAYASTVRAAKQQISTDLPSITNLDADIYDRLDYVHINQQGFRDLASDLFNMIKDYWSFE